MSTNFAQEFSEDVTSLSDFSEESWEEALFLPREHHSESKVRKLSRRLERGVPSKRYRLVYNEQVGSVRLEPQQIPDKATGLIEDQLSLDDQITAAINASKSILNLEDN